MTIASEITRITGNIADTYTAASNKGATLPATQDSDNLATCIASIPSGGGGSGKYQLLERVKDDSNNEIGTVSGFFTDVNDVEYAVVCLDAQYRLASGLWCSNSNEVTNLPLYSNLVFSNVWESKETATFNTQKILDYCSANNYTSTACSHCRSKSFTIDGVVYYGQLPNVSELNGIARIYNTIETLDTSSSSYYDTNFSDARDCLSSNQVFAGTRWGLGNLGSFISTNKSVAAFVAPVLEIPNS